MSRLQFKKCSEVVIAKNSTLLIIVILSISNWAYSQKRNSNSESVDKLILRIEGTWIQMQDTTVTLIINENEWTFVKTDFEGNTVQDNFIVKYDKSTSNEGNFINGLGVATLKMKSTCISYNIDGIKSPDSLYLTNLDTMESYGYLRK